MDENDLKRYTVILGGGSGILFQPLDETITYILTAKHVLYKDVKDGRGQKIGEELIEKINFSYSNDQSTSIEFEIKKDENYFEHDVADAAILVLKENLGFNQIFVDERATGFDGFSLTGYPAIKRLANDKYDRQVINTLISSNTDLISLRLFIDHLDHSQITGFSGGGIIKTNGDSLLLVGIQSKTPIGDCHGEIQVVPIKRFEEIVDVYDLSKLVPSYLSNIELLINSIIGYNETLPALKPKLQIAIRKQFEQVRCALNSIYSSNYVKKLSTSVTGIKSKRFWTSFLEYALIISLLEVDGVDEDVLSKMNLTKKFIFSDSSKDIYDLYSEVLLFASENISDNCQVLLATNQIPNSPNRRRMLASEVNLDVSNVIDIETIDRVQTSSKIKEIIHLKAIEFDCINSNENTLNQFSIQQFEDILTEIKRLVYEFFNN
ncbi:ABC-three component system protein [Myroides sp.]|uniref:ABC-three component system protein n=1 Tax=Myroides sp. TaxID=1874736 RepID=UPI0028A8CF10|nr:ABC-three component system protein [Myroides sp.]